MRKLSETPPQWVIEMVLEHRKNMAPLKAAMEETGSTPDIREYDEAFNQEAESIVDSITTWVDDHLAGEKKKR